MATELGMAAGRRPKHVLAGSGLPGALAGSQPRRPRRRRLRRSLALPRALALPGIIALQGLLALAVLTSGCQNPGASGQLGPIYSAYHRGDYVTSYRLARAQTTSATGATAREAAYVAGLSAKRLGDDGAAEYYLQQAVHGQNLQLAANAESELGLMYLRAGRYRDAAQALAWAAPHLKGVDQANAWYFAGIAQQKLGQWDQARVSFLTARGLSTERDFRARCQEAAGQQGFAIQMGAYSDRPNAFLAARQLAGKAQAARLPAPRVVPAVDAAGQKLYLVQIGRFDTLASAESMRQRLGLAHAILVSVSR